MLENVTGLRTGLAGLALAAAGLLVALLASVRMLWVARKPAKGRIARGVAVGGLVLLVCGAVLVAMQEKLDSPQLALSDRLAYFLVALAVVLAVHAGYRSARRRKPATASAPPAPPVDLEPETDPERPPGAQQG